MTDLGRQLRDDIFRLLSLVCIPLWYAPTLGSYFCTGKPAILLDSSYVCTPVEWVDITLNEKLPIYKDSPHVTLIKVQLLLRWQFGLVISYITRRTSCVMCAISFFFFFTVLKARPWFRGLTKTQDFVFCDFSIIFVISVFVDSDNRKE